MKKFISAKFVGRLCEKEERWTQEHDNSYATTRFYTFFFYISLRKTKIIFVYSDFFFIYVYIYVYIYIYLMRINQNGTRYHEWVKAYCSVAIYI